MNALLQALSQRFGPSFRDWLRGEVRALLAERQKNWQELESEQQALFSDLRRLRAQLLANAERLDRSTLTGTHTVHAAHRRHPGVQAVFARHGLPRCLDCMVGADETLEEAAFGEGMVFSELLQELNSLLLYQDN